MLNMMIVDDSLVIRRRIERIQQLTQKYKVVASASNGLEAVKALHQHRPQVVTMDLTMPEMDGIECIKALMAVHENLHILVISALSDKTTGIEALEQGARGFLCKPFSDDELLSALDELTEDLHV